MSNHKKEINRRDFLKGAATGLAGGTLVTMGLYSYSPMRKRHFAKTERKLADIGVCKNIKVTNISETSWFDNAVLMGDIKGAGGLLVNQYDYNWPPLGMAPVLAKALMKKELPKLNTCFPTDLTKPGRLSRQIVCILKTRAGMPP